MGARKDAQKAWRRQQRRLGEWRSALGYYRRAIELARKCWPDADIDKASWYATASRSITFPVCEAFTDWRFKAITIILEKRGTVRGGDVYLGYNSDLGLLVIGIPPSPEETK